MLCNLKLFREYVKQTCHLQMLKLFFEKLKANFFKNTIKFKMIQNVFTQTNV